MKQYNHWGCSATITIRVKVHRKPLHQSNFRRCVVHTKHKSKKESWAVTFFFPWKLWNAVTHCLSHFLQFTHLYWYRGLETSLSFNGHSNHSIKLVNGRLVRTQSLVHLGWKSYSDIWVMSFSLIISYKSPLHDYGLGANTQLLLKGYMHITKHIAAKIS